MSEILGRACCNFWTFWHLLQPIIYMLWFTSGKVTVNKAATSVFPSVTSSWQREGQFCCKKTITHSISSYDGKWRGDEAKISANSQFNTYLRHLFYLEDLFPESTGASLGRRQRRVSGVGGARREVLGEGRGQRRRLYPGRGYLLSGRRFTPRLLEAIAAAAAQHRTAVVEQVALYSFYSLKRVGVERHLRKEWFEWRPAIDEAQGFEPWKAFLLHASHPSFVCKLILRGVGWGLNTSSTCQVWVMFIWNKR